MFDFFWDINQQRQISKAGADTDDAKRDIHRSMDRVEQLEFSLQRMALASQAMWELMRSRLGITETELLAKIKEIDLRDGVEDQRMTPHVTTCPECGKTLNTKNSSCIYCGATIRKPHVFL